VQVNLADFSDNHWVTCFQETAEQILGKKADEIGRLKESVKFQMRFIVRCSYELFGFKIIACFQRLLLDNQTMLIELKVPGRYSSKLITLSSRLRALL
jgi:hypothetical protein